MFGVASDPVPNPRAGYQKSSREQIAIFGFTVLFGLLLAVMSYKHEMYLDEAQAWLVARDYNNMPDLIRQLHYDCHPVLWYLLLYLPAHLSLPMTSMQVLNYVLSLGTAYLILTYRRMPFIFRVLFLFGPFFFFMGVLARNYMLSGFLLIAAARCLQADRRRHWLAMLLLALAINAHFLAIPVVIGIFVWMYLLAPSPDGAAGSIRLKERQFWMSLGILALALAACYFTIRPAPDVYAPGYHVVNATPIDYLVLGVARVWTHVLPFNLDWLSRPGQFPTSPLTGLAVLNACFTVGLWLLALSALPGRRSRWFMFSASILWITAVWPTVHVPHKAHSTFLIISYIIALMIRSDDARDRSWLPEHLSQPLLILLLSAQVSLCVNYCILEWQYPFSGAKATAAWLKSADLTHHPFIFQSETAGPAVIGYAGVASGYYPACRCRGSFLIIRNGWDSSRPVSSEELQSLRLEFGSSPVLLSQWQLDDATLRQIGMRLMYTSPHGWAWETEDLFVYGFPGDAFK